MEKNSSGTLFRTVLFSAEMIAGGFLFKGDDTKYRNRQTVLLPEMNRNFEDVLRYAPLAAQVGLKLAGVEGRSSWSRMLVTDALATGMTVGTVALLKGSVDSRRPDGSDYRSFPSGHTAMAFMGATLLHREYGMTRSPWYTVGGYSSALVTSVARELHHKHWVSDVMVGAGIGVLAGEIAYQLTDWIFGKKGLRRPDLGFGDYDYDEPHSSLGLEMGTSYFLGSVALSDGASLRVRSPFTVGLYGEWGLTPRWLLLGRYNFTNANLYYNDLPLESASVHVDPSWRTSSGLRMHDLDTGLKYLYPLTLRWSFYGKGTVGYTYYNKVENDFNLRLGSRGGVSFGGGIGIGYLFFHNFLLNTYLDYRREAPLEHGSSNGFHNLIFGYTASVLF